MLSLNQTTPNGNLMLATMWLVIVKLVKVVFVLVKPVCVCVKFETLSQFTTKNEAPLSIYTLRCTLIQLNKCMLR